MTAQQRDLVHQLLRDAPFDLGGDVAVHRPLLEKMLTAQPLPADVRMTPGELGGVPVIAVDIEGVEARGTILHAHGGGFALGSARGSVGLIAGLARRTGMRAVSVDYRLAPEHPFPAGLHDVLAVYRALIGSVGPTLIGSVGSALTGPMGGASESALTGPVVVTGESAGGNLAVEALIAARAEGLPMPAAAVLFSPMTDLTASGDSFEGKAGADPNITRRAILTRAGDYLGDTSATDPAVSPILADLRGLPPLLIQAGSHEVLLDDATRLAARAAAHDVAVILDVTPGVPHVFQAFAGILDEGRAALDRVARFLADNLARGADNLARGDGGLV